MYGMANEEAARLSARGFRAIALFLCAVPSVLSVPPVCRDEWDDFLSPAYFSAHVHGRALPGDLPRNHYLPKCPPVVSDPTKLKTAESSSGRTFMCGQSGAQSRSFLPTSSSNLFLTKVGYKRVAAFGSHACVLFPTVSRANVPGRKSVPCLKFITLTLNLEISAVEAKSARRCRSSRCFLCSSSAFSTRDNPDSLGPFHPTSCSTKVFRNSVERQHLQLSASLWHRLAISGG
jgi:hypothetical protein